MAPLLAVITSAGAEAGRYETSLYHCGQFNWALQCGGQVDPQICLKTMFLKDRDAPKGLWPAGPKAKSDSSVAGSSRITERHPVTRMRGTYKWPSAQSSIFWMVFSIFQKETSGCACAALHSQLRWRLPPQQCRPEISPCYYPQEEPFVGRIIKIAISAYFTSLV